MQVPFLKGKRKQYRGERHKAFVSPLHQFSQLTEEMQQALGVILHIQAMSLPKIKRQRWKDYRDATKQAAPDLRGKLVRQSQEIKDGEMP